MKPTPVLLTVDVVLFGRYEKDPLHLLLIQRKNPPYQNSWALPGGFVDPGEDLHIAARRELKEETSVDGTAISQIGAYGNPDRDTRGRVVTIAFWGEVEMKDVNVKAEDDAQDARWFLVSELPDLAFDHAQIIADGLEKRSRAILSN